jgi:hypothetical protein
MYVIKPIWEYYQSERQKQSGKGLITKTHKSKNTKTDYKYYNDPNELVDRLRLLHASRNAGNKAHDNEIVEILMELKEEKIINDLSFQKIHRGILND